LSVSSFLYDGISLNTFDNGKYVMTSFEANTTPTEGQRNISQTPLFFGKERPFIYQTYDSTLSFSISIIKNPCMDDSTYISTTEMEKLKRWLCRPEPHKFEIYEDSNWGDLFNQYQNIYWEGTFNLTEEVVGSRRIGATLNFISTTPYALQQERIITGEVEPEGEVLIEDDSVEIGYIYPTIKIFCFEDGDLKIKNSFDDRTTILRNCVRNETVTFSKYLQISSDKTNHDIYNDFNYQFLRIGNSFDTNKNNLTFSINCEYEIRYNPIRKVIPV